MFDCSNCCILSFRLHFCQVRFSLGDEILQNQHTHTHLKMQKTTIAGPSTQMLRTFKIADVYTVFRYDCNKEQASRASEAGHVDDDDG